MSAEPTRLAPADIEAIALRTAEHLAELLRSEPEPLATGRLLDASEVAAMLGRSRDWVYAHRSELGVIEVGEGKRPRLLFDPATVRERLNSRSAGERSQPARSGTAARNPRRRARQRAGTSAPLLPIRGGGHA